MCDREPCVCTAKTSMFACCPPARGRCGQSGMVRHYAPQPCLLTCALPRRPLPRPHMESARQHGNQMVATALFVSTLDG